MGWLGCTLKTSTKTARAFFGSPRHSIGDTTLAFGQSFTLQTTVQNQGAGEADATKLTYYRSTDATISISDTPFGFDTVGNLNALATSTESISSTAPENGGPTTTVLALRAFPERLILTITALLACR